MKVLALVDRGTGRARTMVINSISSKEIMPIVKQNVSREATLMTDENIVYNKSRWHFDRHFTVTHGMGEYVSRKNPAIHTNTIEGFFSVFKRGMRGVFQHCGEQHLHRYLAEFEFRYNNREALGCNDRDRSNAALAGITGKRITYRRDHIEG
jgi:transposase-like protein